MSNRRLSLGLFLSLLAAGSRPAAAVGFHPAADTAFSGWSARIAAADADGDGHDELAAAVPALNGISLLWNQGLSTAAFDPPVVVAMGMPAYAVVFADLDRDGLADLAAVARNGSMELVVRRAGLSRTFRVAERYLLPPAPVTQRVIAAVDLDGDGFPEIVVADQNTLSVFHNRRDGTFDPRQEWGVPGASVTNILTGKFDGGARPGVVVAGSGNLQFYRNDGAGNLSLASVWNGGHGTEDDVVALDMNRDGVLDVASTDKGDLWVYNNDGNGNFSGGSHATSPNLFTWSVTADVNGDKVPDLVTAAGDLIVHYGDGAGGFVGRIDRPLGLAASFIAAGDFDGDGDRGDIAAESIVGAIAVRISNRSVSLLPTAPALYPVGRRPVSLAIADLDRDGRADIATADADSAQVSLLWNTGGGAFAAGPALNLGGQAPVAVVAADSTGTGAQDLVVLVPPPPTGVAASSVGFLGPIVPGSLLYLRNLGGRAFDPPVSLAAGQGPVGLAARDLDSDGRSDVAVAGRSSETDGTVTLFQALPGGGYGPIATLAAGLGPVAIALADLDRDGQPDVVVVGRRRVGTAVSGSIAVFRNTGRFNFAIPLYLSAGTDPVGVATPDLDQDGLPDIAVIDGLGRALLLVPNLSTSTMSFGSPSTTALEAPPTAIATADLNCDDADDLLVTLDSTDSKRLFAFLSEGNGTVAPPQRFSAGMGPTAVAAGDLDGRGADDPVVLSGVQNRAEVSLNDACSVTPTCAVALQAAHSYGCALATSPQSFVVEALLPPLSPSGSVALSWSVEPLGIVRQQALIATVELPAGAPAGDYRVRLVAAAGGGCAAEAALDLHLVSDVAASVGPENGLRVARARSAERRVELVWYRAAPAYDVCRASRPVDLEVAPTVLSRALEASVFVDASSEEATGASYYYAVRPTALCGGSGFTGP